MSNGITMTLQNPNIYGNNYHYDSTSNQSYLKAPNNITTANIYEANGNPGNTGEILKAISFVFYDTNLNYSIQIYKNLTDYSIPDSGTAMLEKPVTNCTRYAGIHTINLEQYLFLEEGCTFSIFVTFVSENLSIIRIVSERNSDYGWIRF